MTQNRKLANSKLDFFFVEVNLKIELKVTFLN